MIVGTKQIEFADQLKAFRSERVGTILASEAPVPMEEGARVVLHVVPAGAFEPKAALDLSILQTTAGGLGPSHGGSYGPLRYNFDGLLNVASSGDLAHSYVQIFHHGGVGAVNSSLLRKRDERPRIPSLTFEKELRRIVIGSLPLLQKLGAEPSLYIMLSLLRVKGYYMGFSRADFYEEGHPIDRGDLLVPEVVLESFEGDIERAMRPAFDRVWNASGLARSLNYDEHGKWAGR